MCRLCSARHNHSAHSPCHQRRILQRVACQRVDCRRSSQSSAADSSLSCRAPCNLDPEHRLLGSRRGIEENSPRQNQLRGICNSLLYRRGSGYRLRWKMPKSEGAQRFPLWPLARTACNLRKKELVIRITYEVLQTFTYVQARIPYL